MKAATRAMVCAVSREPSLGAIIQPSIRTIGISGGKDGARKPSGASPVIRIIVLSGWAMGGIVTWT